MEETFIQTNGVRLHVMLDGPKDGQPVLLLHGFPEFWYGWSKQIPALVEAGFRVIVPDQRGYNLSDKPRSVKSYSLEMLAQDMLGLLDALGYEKVFLAGHDWGAAVAWALTIWNPERFYKLAILNVPHPSVMTRFLYHDPEQMRNSWYIFFFQLPWLPEAVMRQGNLRGAERILRGSGKPHTFTNQDIVEYKKAWSQPGAFNAMINWYRAVVRFQPAMPKDKHVKIPTLMLWGKQDFALSYRMAQPSIDLCNDGRLIFFESATHWVQHDEAEAVNRELVNFFKTK